MLATLNERIARMTDSAVAIAAPVKPKAYEYRRWSSKRQGIGDSQTRQSQLATAYATAHGLELDVSASMEDAGVSAFKGKNLDDESKLRTFQRAAEDGHIPEGSYLLLEHMDRFSRDHAFDAAAVFLGIVKAGVTIVTLEDNRKYSRESMRGNPIETFLMMVLGFVAAHEASVRKSAMGKAAWKARRIKAATGAAVSARGPSWLELGADRQWIVIEDRAAVVRRIFSMAANGVGPLGIARALNDERVPTLTDKSSTWHRGSVDQLLRSVTVIGTFGSGGETIPGYYPPVVPEALHATVQALSMGTVRPLRGKQTVVTNILGGVARCPDCGRLMTKVTKTNGANKGASAVKRYSYLVCSGAREASGCAYRIVKLDNIETAMRQNADWLTLNPTAVSSDAGLLGKLQAIEDTIHGAYDGVEALMNELTRGASAAVSERLRATEAAIAEMRGEARALQTQIEANTATLVDARMDRLRRVLADEAADLGAINAALRACVSAIVVDGRSGVMTFRWLHGAETQVRFAMAKD
jgi:DNA invertase Pin-like site-specific DNA recombinase